MLTLADQRPGAVSPRVRLLQVFTAIGGMLLATRGVPPWRALVFGTAGIGMALSSAAVLNQLIDRRIDRTAHAAAWGPSPAETSGDNRALAFALLAAVVSMLVLAFGANRLTALLVLGGVIAYSVLYTAFVKRATPQNIVIGGFVDAIVPLLGWAAVTDMQSARAWAYALLLVLIVFTWTPPHRWPLAIAQRGACGPAGIPMLPAARARVYVLFYTMLLVLVSVLPYVAGLSGLLYLGGALALGVGFLYCALRFLRPPDERFAMRVFGYSNFYLYALFAFLLADHWLAPSALQAGDYVYRLIG